MTEQTYTYSIVENHEIFRQGFNNIIELMSDYGPLTQYANGKELIDDLDPDEHRIIFLDIDMPVMNGLETLKELQANYKNCRAIMLTMHNSEMVISELMEQGASGYLLKEADIDEVFIAIESVKTTGYYFSDMVSKAMINGLTNKKAFKPAFQSDFDLTKREVEILKLICREMTTQEISEKLFISKRTVEGHRNNMLTKTKCKNTAGLVVYAVKNNIIEEDLLHE